MNMDRTEIFVLLDSSGSMASIRHDTIGGLNTFIEGQKNEPGDCRMSLVQFSRLARSFYRETFPSMPIGAVVPITPSGFVPNGDTPLYDAMGRAIDELGSRLANMPEKTRPGKVIFVTITDGEENASQYVTRAQVFERVEHQRSRYGWQFVYLGANQDSIGVARDLGLAEGATMDYAANSKGVAGTYAVMSSFVRRSRAAGGQSAFLANNFSEAERGEAMAGEIVTTTTTTTTPAK